MIGDSDDTMLFPEATRMAISTVQQRTTAGTRLCTAELYLLTLDHSLIESASYVGLTEVHQSFGLSLLAIRLPRVRFHLVNMRCGIALSGLTKVEANGYSPST